MKKHVPIRKIPYYFLVKLKKTISKNERTSNDIHSVRARNLCFKLIKHHDSILHICPVSSIRFLENNTLNLIIVIKDTEICFLSDIVVIINISLKNYRDILEKFDKVVIDKYQEVLSTIQEKKSINFNQIYQSTIEKL